LDYNQFEDLMFVNRVNFLSKRVLLSKRDKWISDSLSSYSVSLIESEKLYYGKIPVDALGSLCWLLAVYMDLPAEYDYLRSLVLNKILQKAQNYKFEGQWTIFREIYDLPEDETFDLTSIIYEVLLNNFSKEDIYGNLIPRIAKYIKFFRATNGKLVYLQVVRPGIVRRPKRKRGYNDKGHRILYNQRGSNTHLKGITVSENNPEKSDRLEKYPSTVPTKYMWFKDRGTDG